MPKPNCLVIIGWPGHTHSAEKIDEARVLNHAVAACVAGGAFELKEDESQGYSNYGKTSFKASPDPPFFNFVIS